MNAKQGDLLRLQHISKCISDLEQILNGITPDSFYRNSEKKYAVERVLEIIGEAVNKISAQTLAKSNQPIPWRDIIDFRNLVTHEYLGWIIPWFTKSLLKIPKVKAAILFLIDELEK